MNNSSRLRLAYQIVDIKKYIWPGPESHTANAGTASSSGSRIRTLVAHNFNLKLVGALFRYSGAKGDENKTK